LTWESMALLWDFHSLVCSGRRSPRRLPRGAFGFHVVASVATVVDSCARPSLTAQFALVGQPRVLPSLSEMTNAHLLAANAAACSASG
jgi:hypothetical protein